MSGISHDCTNLWWRINKLPTKDMVKQLKSQYFALSGWLQDLQAGRSSITIL